MRVVRFLLVWSYFALPAAGDKFQPLPKHDTGVPQPTLVFPGVPAARPMDPAVPPMAPAPAEKGPKLPPIDALLTPDSVKACIAKAKIDPKKFTARELEILKDIQDGKEPSFDKVSEAWLDSYLNDYNAQRKTNLAFPFVKALLQHAIGAAPVDPFALKKQFEKRLETDLAHGPLKYNGESKNPLDLLLHGKAQCASGTSCYSLAARFSWGSDGYRSRKPVAIYTRGHVLPGFIVEDEKGEKYLLGLETTVAGEGKRIFGKVSELAQHPDALQVLDAETYALLDLFGTRLDVAAARCLLNTGLEKTAVRHGLDLVAMEKKVEAERKLAPAAGGKNNGGRASVLGFGVAVVPPGDQKRSEVDLVLPPAPMPPAVPLPPRVVPPPVDPKGKTPTRPPLPKVDPKGPRVAGPPGFYPDFSPVAPQPALMKDPKGLDEIFKARDTLLKNSRRPDGRQLLENAEQKAVKIYLRLAQQGKTADFDKTLLGEFLRDEAGHAFDVPSLVVYLRAYASEWTPPAVQKPLAVRHAAEDKLRAHFETLFEKKESASIFAETLLEELRDLPMHDTDQAEALKFVETLAAYKADIGNEHRKGKEWTKEEREKLIALAQDVTRASYPLMAERKKIFAPTARGKEHQAALTKMLALAAKQEPLLATWGKDLGVKPLEMIERFAHVRGVLEGDPKANFDEVLGKGVAIPKALADEVRTNALQMNELVENEKRLNPYREPKPYTPSPYSGYYGPGYGGGYGGYGERNK